MIVIAHNIRSMHNVGAIFRSCAAFGVEHLYLTGITATPPRKEIAKTALGAEHLVAWSSGEIADVIVRIRESGYTPIALETGADAMKLSEVRFDKVALVLGNEVEGLDAEALQLCEGKVMIPMVKKQSLNVSVACGVALYALTNVRS